MATARILTGADSSARQMRALSFRDRASAEAGGYVLGALLMLVAGGSLTMEWTLALAWGAMTVGMFFFTGVALINGWVMHFLVNRGAPETDRLLYDAFNRLLIGYGWLGNPLFLLGLTTLAVREVRAPWLGMARWAAWAGAVVSVLSWAAASARPPVSSSSSR